MSDKSSLQDDWPADPTNEELVRLAKQLEDAVPPLPAEAQARVQQQVQAELDRLQRRHRRRRLAFGWSIAAAILLALGSYAFLRPGREAAPQLVRNKKTLRPGLIEDRVTVALGESAAAPAADKPLVRLDEYRSLFAD